MPTVIQDQTLFFNLTSTYSSLLPLIVGSITLQGSSVAIDDQTMFMNIDIALQDQTMFIGGFLNPLDQTMVIGGLNKALDQTMFFFIVEKILANSIVTNVLKLPFDIKADSALTHTGTHLLLSNTDGGNTNFYLLENKTLDLLVTTPVPLPIIGIAYKAPYVYIIEKGTKLLKRLNLFSGLVVPLDDTGIFTLSSVTTFNTNSALAYNEDTDLFYLIDGDNRLFEYDLNTDTTVFKQQLTYSDFGGLEYDHRRFLLRTNNRLSSIFKLDEDGGVALSVLGPENTPPSSITDIGYSGVRAYTIHVNHPLVYELDITDKPNSVDLKESVITPSNTNNHTTTLTHTVLDITENVLPGFKTSALTLEQFNILDLLRQSPSNFTGDINWVSPSPVIINDTLVTTTSDKFLTLFDKNEDSGLLLESDDSFSIYFEDTLDLQNVLISLELYNVVDPETIAENKIILEYSYDGVHFALLSELILDRNKVELIDNVNEFIDTNISSLLINHFRVRAHVDNSETVLVRNLEVYQSSTPNRILSDFEVSDTDGQTNSTWLIPTTQNNGNILLNSTFNQVFNNWNISGDGDLQLIRGTNNWSAFLSCGVGESLELESTGIKIDPLQPYILSCFGRSGFNPNTSVYLKFYDINNNLIENTSTFSFLITETRSSIPVISPKNAYWVKVKIECEDTDLIVDRILLEWGDLLNDWSECIELNEIIKSVVEY